MSHAKTESSRSAKELVELTCDTQRVAFIFNPASGTLDPAARRAGLEALARAAGLACELVETDRVEGARPLARRAVADGAARVLVSGGDGSAAEAADVLAGTETALAVIPGGTANLLAMNLGIPADPETAVRLALTGEERRIDVGRANGRAFLIMAGIGADAQMIHDADRELKHRLGVLAYFVAAWRNLGRPRVLYTVRIDGRRVSRHAQSVLIANLGRITGGIELVPGADPEDGILEVAILRTRSFRDLAAVFLRTVLGHPRSDDLMEIHRGRRIVIETPAPQPVELDGNELGATTRLEVWVEPCALRIVCPKPEAQAGLLTLLDEEVVSFWGPLAAGAAVAAGLAVRARRIPPGRRNLFQRHPVLTGLGTAAVLALIGRSTHPGSVPGEEKRP